MILLLVLVFLYTSKAIILYLDSCPHSSCQFALDFYLGRLTPDIQLEQTSETLIARFLHPRPASGMSALLLRTYLIKYAPYSKDLYHNVDKTDHPFGVELIMSFENFNRCNRIIAYDDFTYYQCFIELEYENEANFSPKKIEYRITVGTSLRFSNHYIAMGGRILKDDCDCDIVPNIKYTTKMYIGASCDNEIKDESQVNYGEYLCWEVRQNDPYIERAEFQITSIKVSSEDETETIEAIDLASLRCRGKTKCDKGRAYAIFRPLASGWLKYSMVVKFRFEEANRKSEGMNVRYSTDFVVLNPDGSVPSRNHNLGVVVGVPVTGGLVALGIGFLIYCNCKKKGN